MKATIQSLVTIAALFVLADGASAQAEAGPGTEEFGLTPKQLVQRHCHIGGSFGTLRR